MINKIYTKLTKTTVFLVILSFSIFSTYPALAADPLVTEQSSMKSKSYIKEPLRPLLPFEKNKKDLNNQGSIKQNAEENITPADNDKPEQDPATATTETNNNTPSTNNNTDTNQETTKEANNNSLSNNNQPINSSPDQGINNKKNLNTSTETNNTNQANNDNKILINSNTGLNEVNYNTGNASVKTGDADSTLNLLNFINSTFTTLPGSGILFVYKNIYENLFGDYIVDPLSGETYALNGARINTVDSKNSTIINNNNDANLSNNFALTANSGNNEASYNTGNGNITTGDANVALNLFNFLNSSITASQDGVFGIFNVFGNWTGNLLIPDSMLGSNNTSTYFIVGNNITDISNTLYINNNNNADISNNLNIYSNTGGNETSYNTGSGAISTGDATLKLAAGTLANQNIIGDTIYFIFVNVLGTWTGTNLLPSPSTNPNNPNTEYQHSVDSGIVKIANSTDITNNNQATINNNIDISANIGLNEASYNTGNGNITTGNANVLANILNLSNINIVASKVVLMVVNVFGNWIGNIDTVKHNSSSNKTSAPPANQPLNNIILNDKKVSNEINNLNNPVVINDFNSAAINGLYIKNNENNDRSNNNSSQYLSSNFNKPTSLNNPIVQGQNTKKAADFMEKASSAAKIFLGYLFILYLIKLNGYIKRKRDDNLRKI